jgi:hypothetical protein
LAEEHPTWRRLSPDSDERHAGWCRGACSQPPGDTGPDCVAQSSDFASSLERPVCNGLKKMKGLAPHPWAITQSTGQSHNQVDACVLGWERHSPFPHECQQSAASPTSCWRFRRPMDVISVYTRPGQHVTDRVGPYQPQVPGAELGFGVRWKRALTSIGVPGPSLGKPPWWFLTSDLVACQGRVPLPDSSVAHCVPG